MKKLLFVAVIIFSAMGLNAQFTKAKLQATGLTCALCSNAINKALEKVPFVASVRSDIKNSAFNIVFKQEVTVDIDQLKDAVEDAGFSVGHLELTGQFEEQQLSKDSHFSYGGMNFHYLGNDALKLAGEQTITVVDKNYVSAKEFKKLSGATTHGCYLDGRAGDCCSLSGIQSGARIYHIRI